MTEDYQIKTISVDELKKQYDEIPNLCLIDVRELDEWQACHIPGAMHIPKDQLSSVIDVRMPDRTQPIYLLCRGGVRSLQAAQLLMALGYQQIYSVDGGIMDWSNAGYPIKEAIAE